MNKIGRTGFEGTEPMRFVINVGYDVSNACKNRQTSCTVYDNESLTGRLVPVRLI